MRDAVCWCVFVYFFFMKRKQEGREARKVVGTKQEEKKEAIVLQCHFFSCLVERCGCVREAVRKAEISREEWEFPFLCVLVCFLLLLRPLATALFHNGTARHEQHQSKARRSNQPLFAPAAQEREREREIESKVLASRRKKKVHTQQGRNGSDEKNERGAATTKKKRYTRSLGFCFVLFVLVLPPL